MGPTILRRRLVERREPNEVFNKLSQAAKELAKLMARLFRQNRDNVFSINDLRALGVSGWRKISDLFYELESRRIGTVRQEGTDIVFHAFIPALQNIGE